MKHFLLTIGLCLCTLGVAMGQSTIYSEDFTGDDGKGAIGPGNTVDVSGVDWTVDVTNADLSATSDFFHVVSGVFTGQDVDGTQQANGTGDGPIWISPSINIAGYTNVTISLDVSNNAGGFESQDFVKAYYVIDGGSETTFGFLFDDDGAATNLADSTFSVNGLSGTSLKVYVEMDNNAGGESITFDNVLVQGTESGGTPDKLVVTSVNSSSSPSNGTAFDVVVQAQENDGTPANVSGAVGITLTKATGSGTLGGTLTGTIADGTNEITISGVTYNTTESGVSITASDDASNLTAGTSSTFEVLAAADQLVMVDVPTEGSVGAALSTFTVEARRSGDSSVDLNYTKSITVSIDSGTGSIGGTTSKSASSGVSTFDDITLSAADTFTLEATDGSLTSAASAGITVTSVNGSPAVGDVFISEYSDASGSGNFIYEFLELYNPKDEAVDLDGYVLRQRNSTQSYTFSGTTIVQGNGFLVIGRDADESAFETHHGITFSDNVTYVNGSGSFLSINGGEDFLLEDGSGTNVDPATDDEYTAVTLSSSGNAYRISFAGNATTDWVSGSDSDASPGTLDVGVAISGTAGWRMLSFPISGGAAEDISDDTAIQGVSGGDNTGETSNFMTYDNTGAFETPASVSTNLGNGYGFIAYFYDNTDAGSSELPITLDAAGTEPSSDVSVDLNVSNTVSSSYYTMAGNPYATNFNLNSITATGGSIQNNVHFWDNGSDSYSALDRTTPYIVEPWQGFWVETTSSDVTAISMPTSGKTTDAATGTFFSKENPNSGDINFTLSSETTFDKAIRLSARPNAVLGYDVDDASKFTPLVNSYATMSFVGEIENEDKLQSVFSVPSNLEEEITIPLQVSAYNASGEFTFAWENVETVSENWDITLTDYETGNTVSLRDASSYTFTVNQQAQKSTRSVLAVATTMESNDGDSNRFGITIAPSTSVSIDDEIDAPTEFTLGQNYPNPFNPTTNINYSVGEAGPVNITVYNVMGQKVAELLNTTKNAGSYQLTWNATGVASGIYYYRLTAPGQVLTRQMTLIK